MQSGEMVGRVSFFLFGQVWITLLTQRQHTEFSVAISLWHLLFGLGSAVRTCFGPRLIMPIYCRTRPLRVPCGDNMMWYRNWYGGGLALNYFSSFTGPGRACGQ